MDIVERLTSHWGGERCVDVSIDVADAIDEIKRLRDEIYNLKLAVAGGEDALGSADLVGLEDVIMWRKLWTDEIERLRGDKSVLITSFRINMMRLCPDYSHDEFDKDIAAMLKEKE